MRVGLALLGRWEFLYELLTVATYGDHALQYVTYRLVQERHFPFLHNFDDLNHSEDSVTLSS